MIQEPWVIQEQWVIQVTQDIPAIPVIQEQRVIPVTQEQEENLAQEEPLVPLAQEEPQVPLVQQVVRVKHVIQLPMKYKYVRQMALYIVFVWMGITEKLMVMKIAHVFQIKYHRHHHAQVIKCVTQVESVYAQVIKYGTKVLKHVNAHQVCMRILKVVITVFRYHHHHAHLVSAETPMVTVCL